MTIRRLCESLKLEILAGKNYLDKNIQGCYICDLLSWVIANSQKENIWITVQNNINIVAVAVLAEISCIIIPEGIHIDEQVLNKADEESIPILRSNLNSFCLANELGKLGISND